MYKNAASGHQAALYRGRLADWQNGEEQLQGWDKLHQLQDSARILHDRIKATTDADEKKNLGIERNIINLQIRDLKKWLNGEKRVKDGVANFIVDAAREILPKVQFELICRTGHRMYEQARRNIEEQKPNLEHCAK